MNTFTTVPDLTASRAATSPRRWWLPLPLVATFRAIRRFLYLSLGADRFASLGGVVAAVHSLFWLYAIFLSDHYRLMSTTCFLMIYVWLAFFAYQNVSRFQITMDDASRMGRI